ncbi:ADP-dependent glucokinase-like [Saccostrea cucullata]|uniref:ADP-dependent glucokinase-like n=1 Tax=Saccostrea cuccullata TaxID=36930 RepID=UPI002ED0B2D2
MIAKSVVVLVLSVFIGYIVYKNQISDNTEIEQEIISSWSESISLPKNQFRKLLVGINSNVDLIVPGVELLQQLDISPGEDFNHDQLFTLDHLQETFSHFFKKGSAAERAFMDADLFRKIVSEAEKLSNPQFFIGGNAALIGNKIAQEFPNAELHLVGPVGPKLLELLPKSITIPKMSHIPKDEVHLIMEYHMEESWGNHTAPVATRFITSFDESNSKATMIESFFEYSNKVNPDLIILSGLHLLEGQSPEFFNQKLLFIQNELVKIPKTTPVHLELASMANQKFVKAIADQIVSKVSSLGLNEQEITFLSHAAKGPHRDYFENIQGQPEIHKISDIISWVLKTHGYSKDFPSRKLTRVHFHCLTYHIIGIHSSAWRNNPSAVGAGTRVAGIQACDVESPDPDLVTLKFPQQFKLFSGDKERTFNESQPIMTWKKDGFHFALSPVLVCKQPLKTVGLGDSISATGLMFSEFVSDFLR